MTRPLIEHWFDSQERDMATQYDIVQLARVGSTQDEARSRLADDGSPVLVVAAEQLSGRGRQGREWAQPARGMFASLAFVSDWGSADRTLIPLVAAVAMRLVVGDRFGVDVGLKWPNDFMIDGHKVGGILVETSGDTVVVGCGVNLWWDDPIDGAASLFAEDPGSEVASGLAERWADSLLALLEAGCEAWPRADYVRASVTLGVDVHWDDGHGRAVGIADDGALIVDQGGATIELHSGEVHTRDTG